MSGYRVSLSLALVCLWLCCAALAVGPCQSRWGNNAYNIFQRNHFGPLNSAVTVEQLAARRPEEPVQSFLNPKDEEAVKEVCSPKGGKVYQGDKCISKRQFTFTNVHGAIISNTFKVSRVESVKRYLILACQKVNNYCRPVHFEKNKNNVSPAPGAGGCGA